MKIVHIVESMGRGGLERVVCDLAQVQLRDGHQVGIVCLFTDGLLAEEARQAGVPVFSVGKTAGIDLSALMRLRRAIRASDADVIHTHNATAHYHAALVRGRRLQGVLVNTRHGMGGRDRLTGASDCSRLQWEGPLQSLRFARRPHGALWRIESCQPIVSALCRMGFASMRSARRTGATRDGDSIYPKMRWWWVP